MISVFLGITSMMAATYAAFFAFLVCAVDPGALAVLLMLVGVCLASAILARVTYLRYW